MQPALLRDEERNPFVQFCRETDRLFDEVFRMPVPGGGMSCDLATHPRFEKVQGVGVNRPALRPQAAS